MTTINLEQSLLRENRKIATPKELLLMKEYETYSEFVENDALKRIGFNRVLQEGKRIKSDIDSKSKQIKNFKTERVFHVSQIKAICEKYYLRFLPSNNYVGTIDKELPTKITNFEAAYNVKCDSSNTKICAPMESFELKEKPKDPLLFYQINSEYYYLIHKWGNDLSTTRILLTILSNGWVSYLLPISLFMTLLIPRKEIGILICVVLVIMWSSICLIHSFGNNNPLTFVKKNNWNSEYK